MEKERGTKIIAIVALLVGVVGLSIGFAAFSNTLTVKTGATVTPTATSFNVDFSTSSTSVEAGAVAPTKTPDTLTAGSATIDNTTNPTISGLSATFTEPGQKVEYSFYAYNAGEYIAYLKNIAYQNATDGTSNRVCKAAEGTTDSLVQAACDDITLSIKVGSEAVTNGSVSSITNHSLAKNASEPIVVTIEYAANGDIADGDFTVEFGDISLEYRSAD